MRISRFVAVQELRLDRKLTKAELGAILLARLASTQGKRKTYRAMRKALDDDQTSN